MELMTEYSGWGEREMSLFGRVLHSWGNQMLTHTYSLFSTGEITGQDDLSWPYAVLPWGRSDTGKVKLFLLPLPMHPNSYFVCFNGMLELHWKLGFCL